MSELGGWLNRADPQGPVWVYGSGSMSIRVARALEIAFGVDARHLEFSDEGASSLASYSLVPDVDLTDSIVLIGVHNEFGNTHSIVDRLAGVGAQVVPFPSLVRGLGQSGFDFSSYMLTSHSEAREVFTKKTLPFRNYFSDERSLEVFDAFVDYVGNLEQREIGIDEIPENPFGVHPREGAVATFVEAGAFEGGHLDALDPLPTRYIGFEPLTDAFMKLGQKITALGVDGVALPLALGNVNGLRSFISDGTGSAVDSGGGEDSVLVSRLDDIVGSNAVDVLRLDIEGAELDALSGASHTIQSHHPVLQVAIYHRPQDLAAVLDKVVGFGYEEFFLRTHRQNFFDTFLYCRSGGPSSLGSERILGIE